jgi:hypothetical protein
VWRRLKAGGSESAEISIPRSGDIQSSATENRRRDYALSRMVERHLGSIPE